MNSKMSWQAGAVRRGTAGIAIGIMMLGAAVAERGRAAESPTSSPWAAQWIWQAGADVHAYNQTIIARRRFDLDRPLSGVLRITADSFYRLEINGQWVNDGPARSWPEHFQYDEIDATPYLVEGANEIRVTARYYGVGDFHRVPQQSGLLAQLDVRLRNGRQIQIGTDASWEIAAAPAWIANTPKVSIQMEPVEYYDARREADLAFRPAAVLFPALGGPWKDLRPRDVALLTKQPVALRSYRGANLVRAAGIDFCMPAARLVNPGRIEANHGASCAAGMATWLVLDRAATVVVQSEGMKVAIDGIRGGSKPFQLSAGRHLVLALSSDLFSHQKEKALRFREPLALTLENPLDAAHPNPWCFLRFPEYAMATNDILWIEFRSEDPRLAQAIEGYSRLSETLLNSVKDAASFRDRLRSRAEVMPWAEMFVEDFTWQFQQRQVVGDAAPLVDRPEALMHDTPESTVIRPSRGAEVELVYDFGEQHCGYYGFELIADAGVRIDLHAIEHIAPDGRLQHTGGNRNGLRYITRDGVNRFVSLKRRSGRFLYLTLRNQKTPVQIRRLYSVESTYPVHYAGSFTCSDARLDAIWTISTRTLKLCMEDTFTDCPLYEQTHWVGDARNESLLAYGVFGAEDLARRCIRITGQSLERYPIVGCQTPSSWDCLLPAWSFLWGISSWDYYWRTGDREFLGEIYPAVIANLQGAEKMVNEQGLFSAPYWNLFDWSGIDQGRKTVLHNSMFMVGAIDAAIRAGEALGDGTHADWLKNLRARLVRGINRWWDPARGTYPDSIHDSGNASPSTCQHTSFLSILYDILPNENWAQATRNLTNPPPQMVRIGSPFAMLYLYETYEKLGMEDEIVREIYRHYLPMVESGATTVWESFPSGTTGSGGFPTRSHCHAWSSAPTRFLNRIVLGIRETAPGGRAVRISPRLNGLSWARGAVSTVRGPVHVSWKLDGKSLAVQSSSPATVEAVFERNDSHAGLEVTFNGQRIP